LRAPLRRRGGPGRPEGAGELRLDWEAGTRAWVSSHSSSRRLRCDETHATGRFRLNDRAAERE
jgi:hypothetical protein